jgi:hypothetical protein
MVRLGWYLSCVCLLIQFSCASQNVGAGGSGSYHEDLSLLRPKFPEKVDSTMANPDNNVATVDTEPTTHVNSKVDGVLDSLDKLNTLRRYVDGFTIQLYSGQNREEAINARNKVYDEVGTLTARLEYTQPKFRVTTGNYFTRLEAQKDLYLLKKHFPYAILVPERVPIK